MALVRLLYPNDFVFIQITLDPYCVAEIGVHVTPPDVDLSFERGYPVAVVAKTTGATRTLLWSCVPERPRPRADLGSYLTRNESGLAFVLSGTREWWEIATGWWATSSDSE